MGLTLEFIAGDRNSLITAFQNADFDALYELPACACRADFSLHLIPQDLDCLSESFGEVIGCQPLALRPFLLPSVDGEEGGLLDVDRSWVCYIASCDASAALGVSDRWVEKMRESHPDEQIDLTSDMTDTVGTLIALCKHAQQHDNAVVHVWFQ